MNNYYRFYKSVWGERVKALSSHELYEAILGNHYPTDDNDLSSAIFDLAYEELNRRGEVRARGSALPRSVQKLVGSGCSALR
jgi:hypothetical protein